MLVFGTCLPRFIDSIECTTMQLLNSVCLKDMTPYKSVKNKMEKTERILFSPKYFNHITTSNYTC